MNLRSSLGYLSIIIFTILIFLYFWSFQGNQKNKEDYVYKKTNITIGDKILNAEIADTPSFLEKGLSGRTNIDEDYAMLFVFSKPGKYKFWMKDMNFPIDIIWLDENKRVVYIEKNLRPDTYPRAFGPDTETMYVIEVKSGKADELGLYINQEILF